MNGIKSFRINQLYKYTTSNGHVFVWKYLGNREIEFVWSSCKSVTKPGKIGQISPDFENWSKFTEEDRASLI